MLVYVFQQANQPNIFFPRLKNDVMYSLKKKETNMYTIMWGQTDFEMVPSANLTSIAHFLLSPLELFQKENKSTVLSVLYLKWEFCWS